MVFDMLNATIRKVYRVRSIDNTSSIIGFSLVEGSTRVAISNRICVTIGRRFSKVRLCISGGVSNNWGMVNNRGMVDNRGMCNSKSNWMGNGMSNWVGNSMGNRMTNGMGNWMSNNTSCSMKPVGGISYSSNSSSESFGLCGTSVFSLV